MLLTQRLAHLVGIDPADRQRTAEDLFLATERHPMAYWCQLFIAAGIAHMGLVLNSTGVVIGAMLVSPLMTPIVQLGMAFCVGNLFLAVRASWRIVISILTVVAFSTLATLLLPFQQVTAEIMARTQPTALDLFVAIFCGLAAAFTTARSAEDTLTAAAGTAIAIALVPPLGVVGFGIGIWSLPVSLGAALLFITNLAAIILVSNLFFITMGFNQLDMAGFETRVITAADERSRIYHYVKRLKLPGYLARWRTYRVLLPALFVLSVSFPLFQALRQVTWEINTKKGINRVLDQFEKSHRLLYHQELVGHDSVSVRLILLGEPERREVIRNELAMKIAAVSGREPSIDVEIIPSSEFMDRSLKKSSELLNRQLTNLHFKQTSADISSGLAFLPAGTDPTVARDRLRETGASFFEWLNKILPEEDWLGWSLGIGSRETVLSIRRIADENLPDSTLILILNAFKRETGISAHVREIRVSRRLWETATPVFEKTDESSLKSRLAALLAEPDVGVRMNLPDPAQVQNLQVRRRWQQMNDILTRVVQSEVPIDRLAITMAGQKWLVSAVPRRP